MEPASHGTRKSKKGSCRLCEHPERLEIERLLVSGGLKRRELAERYGVGLTMLKNHQRHAAPTIAKALARREELAGTSLMVEMRIVQERAWALLNAMTADGDNRGAVLALRECREVLESLDKMLARAQEQSNGSALVIRVLDTGSEGYCPCCPHCVAQEGRTLAAATC